MNERLHAYLNALRLDAGGISSRDLARAVDLSHTTIAQALSGQRQPSWKSLVKLVLALGGDVEVVKQMLGYDGDPVMSPNLSRNQQILLDILAELRAIRTALEGDHER